MHVRLIMCKLRQRGTLSRPLVVSLILSKSISSCVSVGGDGGGRGVDGGKFCVQVSSCAFATIARSSGRFEGPLRRVHAWELIIVETHHERLDMFHHQRMFNGLELCSAKPLLFAKRVIPASLALRGTVYSIVVQQFQQTE